MNELIPIWYSLYPPYLFSKILKDFPQSKPVSTKNLSFYLFENYQELGYISSNEIETNVASEWHSALAKLGFIYPEVKVCMGFKQEELGKLDTITPAGYNLINANIMPAIQECYLRSMVTPIFPTGDGTTFSPLCWVLSIMLELEKRGEEPIISFLEMATIVITSTPADGLGETVEEILNLRKERNAAEIKKIFDRSLNHKKTEAIGFVASTFRDYADMNIRYLKATGMVQARGKGITLVSEKHGLALQLTKQLTSDEPLLTIYRKLCAGSPLPTDNQDIAIEVLRELVENAQQYGIRYSFGKSTA